MLLDLDDCIGCYGCEAACRETHRYPYHEDWLKVIRREPFLVDGEPATVSRGRACAGQVQGVL